MEGIWARSAQHFLRIDMYIYIYCLACNTDKSVRTNPLFGFMVWFLILQKRDARLYELLQEIPIIDTFANRIYTF